MMLTGTRYELFCFYDGTELRVIRKPTTLEPGAYKMLPSNWIVA